jgi:hypothetical protein
MLLIQAAALALGSLSGTGRSMLGVRTADRPVGSELLLSLSEA